jgi:uncharacterized OB-fold protein
MSALKPAPLGAPAPTPTPLCAPYWEGCKRGELRFQRCAACGAIGLGPARICSACNARELRWELSRGQGVLYSWTVVWRAQQPSFPLPYAPAVVRLDEGFWMLSAIIGCEPEQLRPDLRLCVEFHPLSTEITLPYFRPIEL